MTQAQPHTYMRALYAWWEATDAVQARHGLPPLDYETARRWFESEIEPEDVATCIAAPLRSAPPRIAPPRPATQRNDLAFATRVKALLARPELTQVKLAKLLGVTQSTISKWANGEDPRHSHERRLHLLERSLGGPQ